MPEPQGDAPLLRGNLAVYSSDVSMRRRSFITTAALILAAGALVGGLLPDRAHATTQDSEKFLRSFATILQVVQDSYYDESVGIVSDYMRTEVDTVDPDMDIYTLAEKFIREHRRRFPVVSEGRLVGQISRRDVLRAAESFLHHETSLLN